MVAPGQILAGKYQVERVLGQGGMGVVVSAQHLALGQRVAIKYMLPEALVHPEAVERFLREARAAVRLRSEHVGRVIDVGTFDDGAPYMVMEFLEGTDLSGYLARSGPLPVPHAVDFVLQACEAVAEAHTLGIVHRDLKPANLFLTRRADGAPLIKVLDFGISKATQSEGDLSLTRTTAIMGSPGYMSPEQLRSSRDVDARSDIWALGVILYELTTGRQPFVADTITALALKVAMEPTPALFVPGVAAGFDAVIGRCLEKDPARRFANVAELGAALVPYGLPSSGESAARIARVLQVAVPPMPTGGPVPGTPTTLSGATGQNSQWQTTAGPAKSRRGLIAAVAGGAVAIGVAVAIVLGSGGSGSAKPDGTIAQAPVDAQVVPQVVTPDAAVPPPPTPDAGVDPAGVEAKIEALIREGLEQSALDKDREAIETFRAANVLADGKDPKILRNLAVVYLKVDDCATALEFAKQALKLDSSSPLADKMRKIEKTAKAECAKKATRPGGRRPPGGSGSGSSAGSAGSGAGTDLSNSRY